MSLMSLYASKLNSLKEMPHMFTPVRRRWNRSPVAALALAGVSAMAFLADPSAAAQTTSGDTVYACYVPLTGTVYRIKAPGAPTECFQLRGHRRDDELRSHVPFNWSKSGAGVVGPMGPAGPQ